MSLTAAETLDARRFAGYPVGPALSSMDAGFQGDSANLDRILGALDADSEAALRTMLTDLRQLETDLVAVRANLDTKRAAVWEANPNELPARQALYLSRRESLCFFLGVPFGPGLAEGNALPLPPAVFVV